MIPNKTENKLPIEQFQCVKTRTGKYSLRMRDANGKMIFVRNMGFAAAPFQIVAQAPGTSLVVIRKFVRTKNGTVPQLHILDTKSAQSSEMPKTLNAFEFLEFLIKMLTAGQTPNLKLNPFPANIGPMTPGVNIGVIRAPRRRRRSIAAIRRRRKMRNAARRTRPAISHRQTVNYSIRPNRTIKYRTTNMVPKTPDMKKIATNAQMALMQKSQLEKQH